MDEMDKLKAQEQRIIRATEVLNRVKTEIGQKAAEIVQRQEEITKWVSIDKKIAELKAEQEKLDTAKKSFEETSAKERTDIENKKKEADTILKEANDEKSRVLSDRVKLDAERAIFNAERSAFSTDKATQAERVEKEDVRIKAEAEKLDKSRLETEGQINALKGQEKKTLDEIHRLEAVICEAEAKLAELKTQQETGQSELEASRQKINADIEKNTGILADIARQRELLEAEKASNQKILDDTLAAKDEILRKEERVANMLNRQAEIQAEQDERERKLKEREQGSK